MVYDIRRRFRRFRRVRRLCRHCRLCRLRSLNQCAQSDGEDYLSGLSDDLLCHILSFLPTPDSIRTSVLARRWRHLWASVPAIDFSYVHVLKGRAINNFIASRNDSVSISRLRFSGLSLHRGAPPLTAILNYAKSHGAKDVNLQKIFVRQCKIHVLNILFNWPSLVSLNLKMARCCIYCRITLPDCITLSNLKTLSIDVGKAKIHNSCLERLLSGCPVLEELTLEMGYHWEEVIQIEAPNLRRLTVIPTPSKLRLTCPKLECLSLKYRRRLQYLHVEAPSLTSLQICDDCYYGNLACHVCFEADDYW